jgi:hypothetical protein
MDTPEHDSPLPPLPDDLDDPIALENWRSAWNTGLAEQAGQRNWPWLKPITPETLREIVEGEKQLRADITRSDKQMDLERARGDLNALEDSLRATDPQYESKWNLLAPILKPLFRHIPPANWKALFEHAYARVRLPAGNLAPEHQQELEDGRRALNALEDRLKTQDPAYGAKKAFLMPILKPMFERMPSSRWAAAFEEAYAGVRLPTSNVSAQAGVESRPLDWSAQIRIEDECRAHWTKDIEKWNRAYVEQEVNNLILFELRQKAFDDKLTEQQYLHLVSNTWAISKTLFYALHCGARSASRAKPRFFWLHQNLSFQHLPALCLANEEKRGFAIFKEDLARSAANYIGHPEVRTNHLDWLYLDTMIFCELKELAEEMFLRRMGTGLNWAAVFSGGTEMKYLLLSILFRVLGFVVTYSSGPAVAYWLSMHAHDVAATWVVGLWAAALLYSWITYPFRRRVRLKGKRLLTHLMELHRMLGDRTIAPRKLRERVEAAAADGIVLDGAVTAIIDRMLARDSTAFIRLM